MSYVDKMSYVAAYFKTPKKIAIVDERWIQGITNSKLKNNGRNRNQDFLIYWSATNNVANWGEVANFNAPLRDVYEETTVNGVCYIGRVLTFFGKIFIWNF